MQWEGRREADKVDAIFWRAIGRKMQRRGGCFGLWTFCDGLIDRWSYEMLISLAWGPAVLLVLAPSDVSVWQQTAVTPELCEHTSRGAGRLD